MTGSANMVDPVISPGVLDQLIGYHLRRASGVFFTDFSRSVGDLGIRQVLFGILSMVEANPGTSQGHVGRALGIKRANMVSRINELIDAGYITRRTSMDDRRAFELTLTGAGQRYFDECLLRIRQHEERLLCDLSAAERIILSDLLVRIAAKGD
ncbi:MAG TPA: MarR family transcriptional regulator [Sphingobium sp.]|nr:MarR family transcriptional regulator [Sphingobium sp.]